MPERRARKKANAERPAPNAQHPIQSIPVALTIAGSDGSAGAGIQADLKTFSALGVYGLTAVTCVVAEIPGKVSRIEPVSAKMVREQIEVLSRNFPIAAIKTGLLCSGEIISAVAHAIRGTDILSLARAGVPPADSTGSPQRVRPLADKMPVGPTAERAVPRVPLVIDPVVVATSGDRLLDANAIESYTKELFPLATLITPNLLEAEKFIGEPVRDLKSMRRAGTELARRFRVSILLKGGHLAGDDAVDLLIADGKITEFSAPFVRDVATHGTGCSYSAAITAGLASGLSLKSAIGHAKKFVTASITQRLRWKSKSGKTLDALNHFSL
jgi:hydroxymethylpyrimidine/phosphomethylpyrimidine kinase